VKGSASLALFEQQGRSKTGSLAQADRERLAAALHFETQRLASAAMTKRPFRNAEWVKAAGFAYEPANPTKRLSEYVLAPWF
jgi:hypothetical protein